MVDRDKERIVWIDVETTGIDSSKEKLLQVACIVTDGNLNELDKGFEKKIYYDLPTVREMRSKADPFVQKMHDNNGLWEALPSGANMITVSEELLEYIKQYVPEAKKARLGGNSITLDRNFLKFNMPDVLDYLHYRSYDLSSIAGFFELFVKTVDPFEKQKTHDALDDIKESIAEGRYYADLLENGYPPF